MTFPKTDVERFENYRSLAEKAHPMADPQWAEVLRLLTYIGDKEPSEQPGKLYPDEARLILAALSTVPALSLRRG